MTRKPILFILAAFVSLQCFGQNNNLRDQIAKIADGKGIAGVAILNLDTKDTLSYNGNSRLVLQSVAKFPIAMTVLHMADQHKFKLDKKIHITKADLPETYSPLRDKYPNGDVDVTIDELLSDMVSLSDNDACDILMHTVGGAAVIENYMFEIGVTGIAIRATEAEMAASWPVQYTNWCKPVEMTHLLEILYRGKALKKTTNAYLMNLMLATTTGPKRIKGLLPAGTVVAHKTGTSATNTAGLSPATNDVGIITLPNGQHLAISIFLCNSTAKDDERDLVIAQIAKAAYDSYSH